MVCIMVPVLYCIWSMGNSLYFLLVKHFYSVLLIIYIWPLWLLNITLIFCVHNHDVDWGNLEMLPKCLFNIWIKECNFVWTAAHQPGVIWPMDQPIWDPSHGFMVSCLICPVGSCELGRNQSPWKLGKILQLFVRLITIILI